MQVEDLLDEALVGVVGGEEEDQGEARRSGWRRPAREGFGGPGSSSRWSNRLSPRAGSRRPRSPRGRRRHRRERAPRSTCRNSSYEGPAAASSGSAAPAAAIITGTSSGSSSSGAIRSRARELTAIEETRAPIVASPRSASSSTAASASSPLPPSKRKREQRHRDQLERDQVDDQDADLGRVQRRTVDRREPDHVEAALLALGDEDAVDRQDRGEQHRRQQDPGGEAALELGRGRGRSERGRRWSPRTAPSPGTDSSVRSSVRRSLARIARKAFTAPPPRSPARRRPRSRSPGRRRRRRRRRAARAPGRPRRAPRVDVVGDEHPRAAGPRAEQLVDDRGGAEVEVRARLVEQQQLGLVEQRRGRSRLAAASRPRGCGPSSSPRRASPARSSSSAIRSPGRSIACRRALNSRFSRTVSSR